MAILLALLLGSAAAVSPAAASSGEPSSGVAAAASEPDAALEADAKLDAGLEDGLAIWLPVTGSVAPMPLDLAVVRIEGGRLLPVGDVDLTVSHGTIHRLPAESDAVLVRARYLPGSRSLDEAIDAEIIAHAGGDEARRTLHLAPFLVGRVEVSVSPERLVKGADAKAVVHVRTLDAEGEPAPGPRPRLTVNVGTLSTLEAGDAPGMWQAAYTPGPARYPEVAVFAAFAPWPHEGSPALAFGHAALPLSAAIDLPGEVRPRVRTTVEIAGEVFGPVTSDRRGHFEVPVVVPPGHGIALGVSLDRFGNRRETEIDLRLPATNRITGAVHPTRLIADGASRARVVVLAVDAFGRPTSEATPRIDAHRGRITDLVDEGAGVFVGWYQAPEGMGDAGGDGADRVTVDFPGDPRSRAELPIALVTGGPARIDHALEPSVVPAPSDTPARLSLRLSDAAGSTITGARIEAEVIRGLIQPGESADGAFDFDYAAPSTATGWEDRLAVRAMLPPGESPAAVVVDESSGELAIVDALGRPVAGVEAEVAGQIRVADALGRIGAPPAAGPTDVGLPGIARPARVIAGRDAEGRWHGTPTARLVQTSEVPLPLMEPVPVDVEVEMAPAENGGLRLIWRVVGGEGDREISVRAGRDELSRGRGRQGDLALEVDPGTPVMVVDVETGISAVVLAPVAPPR